MAAQLLHTAALIAAAHGNLELLKYLVEGRSVDAVNAVTTHVCLVCESLAPCHVSDSDHTPSVTAALAHAGARCRNISVLQYLRDKGARDDVTEAVCAVIHEFQWVTGDSGDLAAEQQDTTHDCAVFQLFGERKVPGRRLGR